ncbi:hypothetical protein I302_101738 [Kwoniella bestiolae CBS 10118]|uniref:COP9 signalosome complex subunit 3 N-terminal helical repeats domain-containing protein n=1 Tax=Kwoniella bestiolae CBS 10118 TaxID=1296100 RepID=A0A1B9GD28_9TREE|nr:hypothetical protein I302_00414 [Kwoniella bestiolae CBS 10118]OCF28924.1 hypothetical protein I302_00414 [Kwoniella bestiolae CBS 10118]
MSETTQPVASSSSAPPSAPAPAHGALPQPPSRSTNQTQPVLPTTSEEITQLLLHTHSLQYVDQVVVPTLQDVADGKSAADTYQGVKLKEKEKIQYGESILACAESDDVYDIPDEGITRMTAGLTYIISARLEVFKNTSARYTNQLLQFAIRLCTHGDTQQFYLIPKRVAQLSWGILRLSQHLKTVEWAIPAIAGLIQRSGVVGYFSPIYAAYLEACLLARQFEAGLLVLDQVFLHVRTAGATYLDVLTYYHHAGLISAALKDYNRAKQYFVIVVSLPTTTTSAIQLASAKRAILCDLLDTGKRISFPKYTASTVTRAIEKHAGVYNDLAIGYEASKWSDVRSIAGKADFANDCNKGLIDQVLKSITKRRVLQLKEMYSRLTINDLVIKIGQSSKETVETISAILGEMITLGKINATITTGSTPANSIVTFLEDHPQSPGTNAATSKKLPPASYLASQLQSELIEMSRRLGISKEYLRKQANFLEMGSGKGKPGARTDDFDQMMAAEEFSGRGSAVRGVGGNYGDMGF